MGVYRKYFYFCFQRRETGLITTLKFHYRAKLEPTMARISIGLLRYCRIFILYAMSCSKISLNWSWIICKMYHCISEFLYCALLCYTSNTKALFWIAAIKHLTMTSIWYSNTTILSTSGNLQPWRLLLDPQRSQSYSHSVKTYLNKYIKAFYMIQVRLWRLIFLMFQ